MKLFLITILSALIFSCTNPVSEEKEVYTYKFTNNCNFGYIKVRANISEEIQEFNLLAHETKIFESENVLNSISGSLPGYLVTNEKVDNEYFFTVGAYVQYEVLSGNNPIDRVIYKDENGKYVAVENTEGNFSVKINNFTSEELELKSSSFENLRITINGKTYKQVRGKFLTGTLTDFYNQ